MGILGLETFLVKVEADVAVGFPAFDIVGLPDTSVKESRDRVKSALRNCGFEIPDGKITINLAPAHIKKEGSVYDLPILMALTIPNSSELQLQRLRRLYMWHLFWLSLLSSYF